MDTASISAPLCIWSKDTLGTYLLLSLIPRINITNQEVSLSIEYINNLISIVYKLTIICYHRLKRDNCSFVLCQNAFKNKMLIAKIKYWTFDSSNV